MPNSDSIVFVNQNAGYLMIDIINAHAQQYRHRTLITGKLNQRNIPLDQTVKIKKIITYNRTSGIKRLFTWSWGFIQILWIVKTQHRKSDLFIVTNPPFAGLTPMFCKNKFTLLIYDVYPDALVAYNFFRERSAIIRVWKNINRMVFTKAKKIFTISEGMKKVLSQYIKEDKITIVPVWTDNNFLKPVPRPGNFFIRNQQLENKFLIIYSGNLGYSHNIEVLIEIASNINDNDIFFLIIGEGDKKLLIKELIDKNKLTNCRLLPWQEFDMLPYTLSAADIAVVTLDKGASMLSVPSKTFNLMSAGAPLLCIAEANSELAVLVQQYQLGKCFSASKIDEMIDFIRLVKSNKVYHESLKQNTLKASINFGPENVFKFVEA